MRLEITPNAFKQFSKIIKKNPQLTSVFDKAISQLVKDKSHPSLRLHKLEGELGEHWSISVNKKLRVIYYQEGSTIFITAIGSHDEVY